MSTALTIICLILYFAIGGIAAGVEDLEDVDAVIMTVGWPIYLAICIVVAIWNLPYYVGCWIRCRYIKRR